MTVSPSKLQIVVPDYPLDQIIGYFTGSVAVGSGGTPSNTTISIPHGFGDSCYFQGIFSSDNGVTWNDFGTEIPTPGSPLPTFQTIGCNTYTDTTNINIIGINWTGTPVTVLYKLYALAKNTMAAPLNPIPTTQKLSFSSGFNFQRIAFKGTVPLNVPLNTTGSQVVIHNLGYVPIVRAFLFRVSSPTTCLPIIFDADTGLSFASAMEGGLSSVQVRLTSSSLTFFVDNTSASSSSAIGVTVDYRIYL